MGLQDLLAALDEILTGAAISKDRQNLVRSLVLLWHDHLDESHNLSQQVGSRDGSYVHGLMHRREPDYGNARYWFHKVGQHPAFPALGEGVTKRLEQRERQGLAQALLPDNRWDSIAMVDLCETAATAPAEDMLREVMMDLQTVEFKVLLNHLST